MARFDHKIYIFILQLSRKQKAERERDTERETERERERDSKNIANGKYVRSEFAKRNKQCYTHTHTTLLGPKCVQTH